MNGLWWKSLLVGAAAFALLSYPVERTGIAAAFSNPVDRIHAQDESIYASGALHMAARGGWLTPITVGRIYLGKPPLLYQLSALSLKVLGVSLFALRFPNLLAGAVATALLFAWCAATRGICCGLTAALLLLADSTWQTFARLCYTDMLLACFVVAALFALARDPSLERSATRWGFITCTAAAILTKSIAGALPALVLAIFLLAGPPKEKPCARRVLAVFAWIALLAAPWVVYQLVAHRQWFWADFVQVQLLDFGMKPAVAAAPEGTLIYYARRFWATDPVLCIAVVLTLPVFLIGLRSRKAQSALLACWLCVVAAAMFAFQWRAWPYALMLLAPLCLMAAGSIPRRILPFGAAVLALALGWNLRSVSSASLPAAGLLRAYLERGRSNELILVDTDDQFYSATLPLPNVRYVFRDPQNITARLVPHYVDLGITVTADQFRRLAEIQPIFRERLRNWGLDSAEPVATTIIARDTEDVQSIIAEHPDVDFYLPATLRRPAADTHVVEQASPDRVFLLARQSAPRAVPRWTQRW